MTDAFERAAAMLDALGEGRAAQELRDVVRQLADPVDVVALRAECEYDPEADGSVDDLIAYKDALEDVVSSRALPPPARVFVVFSTVDVMPMTTARTAELADAYVAAIAALPPGHLMHTDADDLAVHEVPLLADPPDALKDAGGRTTLYVVPTGRWGSTGDLAGALVADDRVWWEHVSSSLSWLTRDLTAGRDRTEALEAAYPDGYDVVTLSVGDQLPPAIAHHFSQIEPEPS